MDFVGMVLGHDDRWKGDSQERWVTGTGSDQHDQERMEGLQDEDGDAKDLSSPYAAGLKN
jgi:hypothetical protein